MSTIIETQQLDSRPFILVYENNILDVGKQFLALTGYEKDEVINNDIKHLCHNLRLHVSIDNLEHGHESFFIFTKSLEAREVTMSTIYDHQTCEKVYTFDELPNSRLDDKLAFVDQLFKDNNVGCSIYSVPDLILLKSNPKYLEFMEPPYDIYENCIGMSLKDCVPGYEGSNSDELFSTILNTGNPGYYNEFRYDHYSRGTTYWDGSVSPIYYDGKIKYIFQIASDITERVINEKRLEEQAKVIQDQSDLLKQQNSLLEAVIENMHDPIAIYDNKGAITFKNSEARSLNPNFRAESIVQNVYKGNQCFDLDNNIIPLEALPTKRVFKGEQIKNERIMIKHPDRVRYIEVNATPIFNHNYDLISAVVCHHDISDLIENQSILKQKNELLSRQASLLDLSFEAIFTWELDGYITYWNRGAEKMYGFSSQEALGQVSHDLLKTVHPIGFDQVRSILFRDEIWSGKIEHTTKDGRTLIIETKQQVILNEHGQLVVLEINRDITEQTNNMMIINDQQDKIIQVEKEKNEALKKAIKMKDEFLSIISHELKTPLTVINSAIQTMEIACKNELSDKAKGYINKILINSNRQLKLVNNILDNTRLAAGHFKIKKSRIEIVSLTSVITESVSIIAQRKKIKLIFSSELEKMVIMIDGEHYERILLNLLSNAIKFTPEGKSIDVTVSKGIADGKPTVCIRVKDSGIGIPNNKKDLIFDRFGQVNSTLSREAEGTGIGLSLVKMLVDEMGGKITLESEEGVGSTFNVIFPVQTDETFAEIIRNESPKEHLTHSIAIEFSDIYFN
jgi:PAS domain S-box